VHTDYLAPVASTLGILVIVLLTIRFRWHPFVAMFFAAVGIGLASGLQPAEIAECVTSGFGKTLGYSGIVVVCGFIIGEFLKNTGGAQAISQSVLSVVGVSRAPLAVGITGYLLAIPVMCCDTAFIVLSPVVEGLASGLKVPLQTLSLALAVGTYTAFKMIPLSPGPLAVVSGYGADFGRVLALGFAASIPVFAAGYIWIRRFGRSGSGAAARVPVATPDAPAIVSGAFSAFLSVGTPVVLIILRAVADSVLPAQDRLRAWVDFLGNPAIALPLGVGLMMLMYRRIGMDVLAGWISSASSRCGSIMIIVGAGGILGAVLQSSGLGDYLGQLMAGLHIPGLLVPFLLAMALKSTQGSSLVTMLTTAALVAPILPGLGISREIAVLATCAGSMAVVHVNDSFFWVVTRFADMDVPSGYRSLTLQTLVQSVVALAVTLALSMFM